MDTETGYNTKLVKPRFGVVVHRIPTEEFDLGTGAFPPTAKQIIQAAGKIIEENNLAKTVTTSKNLPG